MINVFVFFLFCFMVLGVFSLLVVSLTYLLSGPFYDKSGAFECGFQPFSNPGLSFSMPFFIISLMFLLFDVEIILVSFPPMVFGLSGSMLMYWLVLFLILMATCYEWYSGVLEWVSSFFY